MKTIGEAIQSVQSQYSKGVESNDVRLTDRHIYSILKSVRATLISQQSNKRQTIPDQCYQPLPCIELIQAPLHECVGLPSGHTVLRSKEQLPAFIHGLDCPLIKPITTLEGDITFDKVSFETSKYTKGNKYTSTKARAIIRDRYLYLTNTSLLRVVPIYGLFDDPLEAAQYPSMCDEDCNCDSYLDYIFPVDEKLFDAIIDITVPKALGIFKQMNEDRTNNATDDSGTINMIHKPN